VSIDYVGNTVCIIQFGLLINQQEIAEEESGTRVSIAESSIHRKIHSVHVKALEQEQANPVRW
jgi:hypothetical protein